MKNNIIPFPGTSESEEFCGADGMAPMFGEREEQAALYAMEDKILRAINAQMANSDRAALEFLEPEALSEKFKQRLLKVLHRRQKENVREGRILTVSHPLMSPSEQIPYLSERAEKPTVTVRTSNEDDLQNMLMLRDLFPILADVRNGIRSNSSSRQRKELPGYFV